MDGWMETLEKWLTAAQKSFSLWRCQSPAFQKQQIGHPSGVPMAKDDR
jgi:hypothetical protein